jgi:exosome complex component RRP45
MLEAIRADCRVDARTRTESRLLRDTQHGVSTDQVKFGAENGQCLIQLGHTKVITQSVLKIISPKPNKPNEGEIRFNVEFTSLMHSAEFNQQTSTLAEMRVEIANFIEKVIKSSRATDAEGLCII